MEFPDIQETLWCGRDSVSHTASVAIPLAMHAVSSGARRSHISRPEPTAADRAEWCPFDGWGPSYRARPGLTSFQWL